MNGELRHKKLNPEPKFGASSVSSGLGYPEHFVDTLSVVCGQFGRLA